MPVMTFLEAISDALRTEMRNDPSVFMMGEDIAGYGGAFKLTKGFPEEFGKERIVDTPISEAAIIGAAIGASLNGMRVVAEMQFLDFITNGFNQLVTVAGTTAYRWGMGVPIVVRGPAGGGVGGGPFHSRNSEAWFVHATGIKVVYPAFPSDAKGLMMASIRDNNPVVFYEHKGLYRKIKEEVPSGDYIVPLGQGRVVRSGNSISIITYGSMVHLALEIAQELQEQHIQCEVVDIRTLVPFDKEIVYNSIRKTHRALVLHEASITCGFGAEIAAQIGEYCFSDLDAPVKRIGAFDGPTPFAPTLEKEVLPKKEDIVTTIKDIVAF
jgi:2-oxoisovalerate dehydrogenase E1 component beta subunit